MEFEKLNRIRQSCRNFKDTPITDDLILKIIDEALLTPSAKNMQPWRIKVVSNYNHDEICECFQDNGRNLFLNKAPVYLVIYEGEEVLPKKLPQIDYAMSDIGAFTYAISLAAKNKGVDSCIIGYINTEKLSSLIGVNKDSIRLMIALGYGDENNVLRVKNRRNLNEIVSFHKSK